MASTQSSLDFQKPLGATKPAWLYEPLPILYMLAGAIVALTLSGVLAISSGILLIVTGVYVLRMRQQYRKATRRGHRAQPKHRN